MPPSTALQNPARGRPFPLAQHPLAVLFERRLAEHGRNELPAEPQPSIWAVASVQLANPMNVMLAIVAVASILIGQISTGVIVGILGMLSLLQPHDDAESAPPAEATGDDPSDALDTSAEEPSKSAPAEHS